VQCAGQKPSHEWIRNHKKRMAIKRISQAPHRISCVVEEISIPSRPSRLLVFSTAWVERQAFIRTVTEFRFSRARLTDRRHKREARPTDRRVLARRDKAGSSRAKKRMCAHREQLEFFPTTCR